MLKGKKAQLTEQLWEVLELMIAGVIILLAIVIGVLLYNGLIVSPADEAKANNAFNALHTSITDLTKSRKPFETLTTAIQLPDEYIITFFYKEKEHPNVDVCGEPSLVQPHCDAPCMCLYKADDPEDFFKEGNNPDHKNCKSLPKQIDYILTWEHQGLKQWALEPLDVVFPENIKGSKVVIKDFPTFPPGMSYSEVFIYGNCESDFKVQTLYLEKTEFLQNNEEKTVIFLTGKTKQSDLRTGLPGLLKTLQNE